MPRALCAPDMKTPGAAMIAVTQGTCRATVGAGIRLSLTLGVQTSLSQLEANGVHRQGSEWQQH
eukprot:8263813-Pyramimonas_sp.AAC.1